MIEFQKEFFMKLKPTIDEQIIKAKEILKNGFANFMSSSYTNFYRENNSNPVYKVYIFTNENNNYLKDFIKPNDNVLVPTASGDQALNSLFYGANSVETFDINSITQYFFNVKETAIKYLSRKEFLEFYSYSNLFCKKHYDRIKLKLKSETRYFFGQLYDFAEKGEYKFDAIAEDLITNQKQIIMSNPYLENDYTYLKMKNLLLNKPSITHTVCSAEDIAHSNLNKDAIILSNIYGAYLLMKKNELTYNKYLKNIYDHLNDNGTISLNYIFQCTNPENQRYLTRSIKKEIPNCKTIKVTSPTSLTSEDNKKDIVIYANKESIISR